MHVMLNAYWEGLSFQLPHSGDAKQWRRIVDTAKPSPDDCLDVAHADPVSGQFYRVESRSSVLLLEM
jgi:glycogen operon protein